MRNKIVLTYITSPNKKEARKIALHLLKKKLIACANIFPINSLYWWKNKIVDESEVVLLTKTNKDNFEKIIKEVEKIHPYDIPDIIKISAEANDKYARWLNETLNNSSG